MNSKPSMPFLLSDAVSASKGKWMTQTFQTNITVMQDADGIMEIFTVHTENGKKVLTMAEYIDRGALIEWLKRIRLIDLSDGRGLCRVIMEDDFKKAIKKMPKGIIADVAPVRHGWWVDNHCTACGMMPMGDEMWEICDFEPPRFEKFMDYCPN